jgi:hypothetical protein
MPFRSSSRFLALNEGRIPFSGGTVAAKLARLPRRDVRRLQMHDESYQARDHEPETHHSTPAMLITLAAVHNRGESDVTSSCREDDVVPAQRFKPVESHAAFVA